MKHYGTKKCEKHVVYFQKTARDKSRMGSVLQMMQPTAPASLAAQALCAKPQPQQLKPLPIDIHTEQHKGVSVLLI